VLLAEIASLEGRAARLVADAAAAEDAGEAAQRAALARAAAAREERVQTEKVGQQG
jgi:hypothetical protein